VSRTSRDARRSVRAPADTGALLSPEQVAARCGLSRKAVYRAIERGELRASRLCSRLRLRPQDVDSWIEVNAIEPGERQRAPHVALPATNGLRTLLREQQQH
jgi:excisionase family DNA binding protein